MGVLKLGATAERVVGTPAVTLVARLSARASVRSANRAHIPWSGGATLRGCRDEGTGLKMQCGTSHEGRLRPTL